jgi:membrane-associated phospholipid phosphatase
MGGEVMMVLVYVTAQALCKPSRTIYHQTMCLVNVYFTIVMKLVLHNPRPYMVHEPIKVISSMVSSEYGDPSGHTMSAAQVLVSVFLDFRDSQTSY